MNEHTPPTDRASDERTPPPGHAADAPARAPVWKSAAVLALAALAFWVSVRIGLLLIVQPEGLSPIWPASGVALAILLLRPRREWPRLLAVIFMVDVVANWQSDYTLPVSVGFALTDILQACLGAMLLVRLRRPRITFERIAEVLAVLTVATLVNAATALLGAAITVLAFEGSFADAWLVWWASNGLGILLVMPFIVCWVADTRLLRTTSARRIAETAFLVLGMTLLAELLFGPYNAHEGSLLNGYMVFPLLVWLAFRFAPRGVVTVLLVFSSVAIWSELHHHGSVDLSTFAQTDHIVALQIYLAVVTCTGLLMSAVITEQKRSEEALRESEAGLANAQRIARVGSWDVDHITHASRWSDEMYRLFGLIPETFDGRFETVLSAIHPEDRDAYVKNAQENREGGGTTPLEFRVVHPDGTELTLYAQGVGVFDEDGAPVRSSGTAQDITERKVAEAEIRRLNADLERRVHERTIELEAAVRELESFSYSVSHDLRTPLRALDGFSQILLEDHASQLDDDALHCLNRIRLGAQNMSTLINGLLELSRLNRGEIARQGIDLSALAHEIVGGLAECSPEHVREIVIADGLTAEADPDLVRILLTNLFENACKFSSRHAAMRIEFGALPASAPAGTPASGSDASLDEVTVFFVRDDGAGFDMTYADKLFGAFQRLHGSDEFDGTGIGLATVQRIVNRHGGRVWAEAEVEKGATFFFTLSRPERGAS